MIGRDIQSLTKIGPQAAKAEEIKEYETLRTNAREFLGIYCKFQDGMISELFKFALLVLENQMKTELSKSLMLIIICILRDLVKDRKDIHMQLADTLMKLVVSTPAAKKTS